MIYNTIEELQQKICEKVYEVYDIFKDFFGEEFVDLQNLPRPNFCLPPNVARINLPYTDISEEMITQVRSSLSSHYSAIYVYWPHVTITNEHNRSIDIQELYARIDIDLEGKIPYENRGFLLNRASYPMSQFMFGYSHQGFLHSHISSIPKHDFTEFQPPCLGRGPINGTILSLKRNYDNLTWMLFCQELSMYVTVESLSGVPYNKLEEVGAMKPLYEYDENYMITDKQDSKIAHFRANFPFYESFMRYYLTHGHLSLCYKDGLFASGMPFYDFIIDISNTFIEFVNNSPELRGYNTEVLFEEEILKKVVVADRKFYENSNTHPIASVQRYIGSHVLTFKGNDIRLSIHEDLSESGPIISTVMNSLLAIAILNNILLVINYRYKNEYNYRKRGEEVPSPTYQNVRYL